MKDELIDATDELRYAMRKTEARGDPWIPKSQITQFSPYAVALIELMGNDKANDLMITSLGIDWWLALRSKWIASEVCWIDMCMAELRKEGKEVP